MKKYRYAKTILIIMLFVYIIWDLSSGGVSDADIESVAEAVVKAADISDPIPAENRMIKRFYGLNPNDYDGALLYAPTDNMDANELFLVKLSDVSQSESVIAAIDERLTTQKKSFEGYGAEQTKLLNDHVLQVEGNYILYAVGKHAQDARAAFLKSL